jgi:hypothetical protein
MSLKPLQAQMPLGQFDMLDSHISYVKGGEVASFVSVTATAATDKAAYDVFDGYLTPANRTAASLLPATAVKPPYMLTDDGITGYGTLFGTVVGGTVGQVSTGGTVLGPHTATGSGKVTLWASPGLFAISLDAVTASLQPSAGVSSGASIYGTSTDTVTANAGQLTTSNAGTNKLVGNFVEYVTNGSLVNTPNTLAGTFNPPDGVLTTTAKVPTFLVFWFNPASA